MEGASVAQVSIQENIPWQIIRVISSIVRINHHKKILRAF